MTTKNERAATNDGNCQVCGSRQRLPLGKLAKHGYTTRWGFFSGTCYGSGELPFQQDITLVHVAIERAIETAASLRATAADYRNPAGPLNTGTSAQFHKYIPASFERGKRHSSYRWVEVEVVQVPGNGYVTYKGVEKDGTEHKLEAYNYGRPQNVAEFVLALNGKRAADYESTAKHHESFAQWQTERIKGWKPTPLLPRGDGQKPLAKPLTEAQRAALEVLAKSDIPGSGLRTAKLEEALGADWRTVVNELRSERLAKWERGGLSITPKGFKILREAK